MTAKRMSAAEALRRNVAGFEQSLRDRLAEAEAALARYESIEPLRVRYEENEAVYRLVLSALHIWTGGEFGEALPSRKDGVQ